jgi:hypothetical protein
MVTAKKPFRTSRLPSVASAALVLAAVIGLPACESGTGLPSSPIPNAQIAVTLSPSPIVGTQNTTTKAVKAEFDVKIQELNGLGCEVMFVSAAAFDPESGAQVALVYFDGVDLVVYVGSKRIEGQGTLVVPETLGYVLSDGRKEATVVVSVQVKDDRGNLFNHALLTKIQ